MLYFDQFTDFENFSDVKLLLYPQNCMLKIILQNMTPRDLMDNFLSSHQNLAVTFFILLFRFFKDQFCRGNGKRKKLSLRC